MGKRDAFQADGNRRQPFCLGLAPLAVWAWVLTAAGSNAVVYSQDRPTSHVPRLEERRVTLIWCDHYALLLQGFDSMTREVGAIFGEIGVELNWIKGSEKEPAPGDLPVIVALMPNDASAWGAPKRIIGLASMNGTTRAVYIFVPKLVEILGWTSVPQRTLSARQTAELSRALGRIIAHELVHAIAPEAPHTESGLMCAWLNRRHLLHGRLLMSASTTDHVMAGMSTALADARQDRAPIAAFTGWFK